ncbi:hypothetical protein RJ639_014253 [Escallonia herrerae]|uniref:Uncharacterized protein n=1 Tax=Escallonia herrerae TaxID=1293975 RepID=A0AA88VFI5_9ASTE|nr:hypothetical protein RJ639_014253 [Escallonia herrerae]
MDDLIHKDHDRDQSLEPSSEVYAIKTIRRNKEADRRRGFNSSGTTSASYHRGLTQHYAIHHDQKQQHLQATARPTEITTLDKGSKP